MFCNAELTHTPDLHSALLPQGSLAHCFFPHFASGFSPIKASIILMPLVLFQWALFGVKELFFPEQVKTVAIGVSSKTSDRLAIAVAISTTKKRNN